MIAKVLKYVRHPDVLDYLRLGWIDRPEILKGTHHGDHATAMEWPHDREPELPSPGAPD